MVLYQVGAAGSNWGVVLGSPAELVDYFTRSGLGTLSIRGFVRDQTGSSVAFVSPLE